MSPDGKKVPTPQRVAQILPKHLEPCSLSIVVFGPGRGEAIVVVLPDGRVGVVDGCREPTEDPATGKGDPVREFLSALEMVSTDRPFRLLFVCLTHPHDDHYGGMGRLLEVFRGRVDFVWSVQKVGDRYAEALTKYMEATRAGREPLPDDVKLKGLGRVLAELTSARQQYGSKLRHVSQGKELLPPYEVAGQPVSISACGPADEDVDNALLALVEGVEHFIEDGKHDARFDPNALSGALLVRWGQAGILLGGDLLCRQGHYHGWDEVCDGVQPPIQVIKAAHHASKEAHHEDLWKRLGARLAIVTPFKNASGPMPPRPEQITRLAQDAVVAITSVPDWEHRKTHPRPVSSMARGRRVTSARNSVLKLTPKPGPADIYNAVAVSLDSTGRLVRLVLAGAADIYEPPASGVAP